VSERRPLVSVVTPSFNQDSFLQATIESVLSQDYPALEHIVVDGGSSDGSVDILRSYGDRVRWISEPDRGQSHALNKGFAMARGEVLGWVNSDDVLLPGAVAKAAAAFGEDTELGMVHGEGWLIDRAGERMERFAYSEPFNLYRLIHFADTILQQSVFLRKSAFQAVGGVDESLYYGMDWELFIRLGKRFRVRYLPEELGAIRVYEDTKTSQGGFRRVDELGKILERHAGRRWTPSYAGYALGMVSESVGAQVSRLPGGALLQRIVDLAHGLFARRVFPRMEECQGWFHDGWASLRLRVLLPRFDGADTWRIEGEGPEDGRQPLKLTINGRPAWSGVLSSGKFVFDGKLPRRQPGEEALLLELFAGRVVARRRREHGGMQELCYRLRRVTVLGGGSEAECLPPRLMLSGPPADAMPVKP